MFAAITPALIIGAVAERMKFSAVMLFSFLWTLCVYYPIAHAVWGATGDFAGLANAQAAYKAGWLPRWGRWTSRAASWSI